MSPRFILIAAVIIAGGVCGLILFAHQLGEAKDRWVGKLVAYAWMGRVVAWSLTSKLRLMTIIAIVALVGAIVGAITFVGVFVVAREQIEARTKAGDVTPNGGRSGAAETSQDVKSLLGSVQNVAYRDVVAEVIHAFEPKAHITVGGAVLGPDGARTVDIQVASIGGSAPPRITAVDVIDRPDGRSVEIEAIDNAESKRRDLGVAAMLVCSDTGFSSAAISKAKRTNIGLISVLRHGDHRVGGVIEEEIYLRRIKVTPVRISYEGPKNQPGVRRESDPPINEHDLKYHGSSVDAWLENRFVAGIGGITANGPVTFYYRLKKPTNFDLPGGRQMRVTKISISTDVAIQWLSQVVQLDATNAIYDYVRGRVRLGGGKNQYTIKGVNWDTAVPVAEPPLTDPLTFGLIPGEVQIALMYVEGGPIGAKGSPEMDALIDPEDLKRTP